MTAKKIVTIGSAMRDIFLEHRAAQTLEMHADSGSHSFILLEEGRKVEIDGVVHAVGGGATNSAVSFARLGHLVTSFFKTGTDAAAHDIRTALQTEQVDTHIACYSQTEPTGSSFIMPCPSGDNAVLVHRGANMTLDADELPYDNLATSDVIYCTSLSGTTATLLPLIARTAQENGATVATNPGSSQLQADAEDFLAALPYVDILILNAHEAALLFTCMMRTTTPPHTPSYAADDQDDDDMPSLLCAPEYEQAVCFNLLQFFSLIHQAGPSTVVVTNDVEGVYASANNTVYFHPSQDVDVTCSVGAGDAFGSCFVAHLMHGADIPYALRAGILNAASVIQYLDTQTGLLTDQELARQVQTLDPELLQIFELQAN